MRSNVFKLLLNHPYSSSCSYTKYVTLARKCACAAYSTAGNTTEIRSEKLKSANVEEMLDDAAQGSLPFDEQEQDQDWRSSPYPHGSVINPKQSQCLKSLRPEVEPSNTSIILFPGEGSQHIGMGNDLLRFPRARDIFDASNEILKYDLLKLMLNGPITKLNEVRHSQVAIFVCSLAALERIREERPTAIETCIATAGFGIGELTALTFAGVFTFSDGLKLARTRAEAMELAADVEEGGLAKVTINHNSKLGEAMVKAREWCIDKGIPSPECRIAQYIDANVKVVGGHVEALKYLDANKEFFKLSEVKRIPGTVASNTFLMSPAVPIFKNKMRKMSLMDPLIPVHSNFDGTFYKHTGNILHQLPKQIRSAIKWEQTMHILYERTGNSTFPWTYVCGPQNFLKEYLGGVNSKASQYCINVTDTEMNLEEAMLAAGGRIDPEYAEALDTSETTEPLAFTRHPAIGAFNTTLMKPAVEAYRGVFKTIELHEPSAFVYANYDNRPYKHLKSVPRKLIRQIYKPLMWEQIIHRIYNREADKSFPKTFTCGPGYALRANLQKLVPRAGKSCFHVPA